MIKRFLHIGLAMLLAACSVPDTSTPAPTPEAIHVIYASGLKPWADKLGECASGNPRTALYFSPALHQEPDIFSDEVTLIMGEPEFTSGTSYLSKVGSEQIVVIVNQSNVQNEISTEQLRTIYTGQFSQWEGTPNQPIQVWVLPDGNPVRTAFNNSVMQSQRISTEAMLAPDPEAMLEAVSNNPDAIGYLPESILASADPSLAGKVRILELEDPLKDAFTQPILAITAQEPQGQIRELIACLQSQGH